MLKTLKQRLDRAAIDIAAKSLSPGVANRERARLAAELLQRTDLLSPPGTTGQMVIQRDRSFTFPSSAPVNHPRNDVVYGKLFLLDRSWTRSPFVILIHGWNAELHYLYLLPRLARRLNKAGLNAALIELPYHMHRRPLEQNGMRDFISDDLPGMLLATKQAISDIDSLCRWAIAQGCVTTSIWGFSLGAWLAGLYICESNLPQAAVLTTPVSDLARGVSELPFCHPIRSGLDGEKLDLAELNLSRRTPQLNPDAIQVVQGAYDLFVPDGTYAELARAGKLRDWAREPHGHISILMAPGAQRRAVEWLKRRLTQPS